MPKEGVGGFTLSDDDEAFLDKVWASKHPSPPPPKKDEAKADERPEVRSN